MALSDRVVVMHQARVLQVGPPEALYRRPANRTVAAFFGQPNLLAARVTGCEAEAGGIYRLGVVGEAQPNSWSGSCRVGRPSAAGEPVTVVVRPETIELRPGPSGGRDIGWAGKVVQSTFRGASRSLLVETAGGLRLGVETPALGAPAIGDTVSLGVVEGGAWAVTD